ncbi:acetate--CoA ligase family protein [Streptomyces sp. 4F14]|uniref:acetate--CoA ligase family protein n=1 Tax=Streptomyces sp. 4F14 TaxID=3394380 RepID=UPI003A88346C
MDPLAPLFAPRAIAVLGGYTVATAAFPGPILKVDADRPDPTRRVHPTVAGAAKAHDTVPDLVVCAAGASTADVLREAAGAGARAALVHGDADAADPRELAEVARETGLRVLGPGTSGFVVPHRWLVAGSVPGLAGIEAGPVALVAADDGVLHTLAHTLAETGVGLRLGVAVGNGPDVTQADVLRHLAEDDGTRAVALHVTDPEDGRGLADAVRALVVRTPVVALVVRARGRGGGAVAWRVARAALRQAGAVLVDDERDLVDAVTALGRIRLPAQARAGVGLVTVRTGDLLTGSLRARDVSVPPLVPCTVGRLDALLPAATGRSNPVDAGSAGPALGEVVERVSEDPGIHLTAVHGLLGPAGTDLTTTLCEVRAATPLVAVLGGPPLRVRQARGALAWAGIPCATTPAAGVTMVRALAQDAEARARLTAADTAPPRFPPLPLTGDVDEHTVKRVLAQLGVRTPQGRVCAGPAEAHRALDELDGPLVLKSLDAPYTAGAQIRTHDALDAALAGRPAGSALFLERAVPAGPELVVAVRRDPSFGPVIALGAGDPAAEALGDASLRLAPLSVMDTHTMLDELLTLDVILGAYRVAAVDRTQMCHVLLALSCLAADERVAECEIDLRILPDGGVVAVDATLLMTD